VAEDNGRSELATVDELYCSDAPCAVGVEAWTMPIGRAELIGARCNHMNTAEPLPVCECTFRRTRIAADSDPNRPWEEGTPDIVRYPGNRPDGCSEYGRTPSSCVYCESDFPGCSVDDATSCDVVCADMAVRYDAELRKTFSAVSRVARCGEDMLCQYVTEIDGLCYARDPSQKELPTFDCALSDEEILQNQNESYAPTCSERPGASCATANDCPRGLACDDTARCVGCGNTCEGPTGGFVTCSGQPTCAEGEACIQDRCLLQMNVECVNNGDCPSGTECRLSGIDASTGRGNRDTRSYCRSVPQQ
jgi:hypothetical protein